MNVKYAKLNYQKELEEIQKKLMWSRLRDRNARI